MRYRNRLMTDGKLVFEEYFPGDKFNLAQPTGETGFDMNDTHNLCSVTKSFTSALIGIAIDKGFIQSVNQKVFDFFPEYSYIFNSTPEKGIGVDYGLGRFSVQDDFFSSEKYSGTLSYFKIGWSRFHENNGFQLNLKYRSSSEIKNNQFSADVVQFSLELDYLYSVGTFSLFSKKVYAYLGPYVEFFTYYNKQNFARDGIPYNYEPIQPNTDKPRYMNPVIILINGTTISGGELLAELMNQIPTVTILGDTTNGAGCNDIAEDIEGDYVLPSGKYIHVGTTYALRYDGLPIEWNGVLPEIRIPQTAENVKNGRDKQLEYAISFLD